MAQTGDACSKQIIILFLTLEQSHILKKQYRGGQKTDFRLRTQQTDLQLLIVRTSWKQNILLGDFPIKNLFSSFKMHLSQLSIIFEALHEEKSFSLSLKGDICDIIAKCCTFRCMYNQNKPAPCMSSAAPGVAALIFHWAKI